MYWTFGSIIFSSAMVILFDKILILHSLFFILEVLLDSFLSLPFLYSLWLYFSLNICNYNNSLTSLYLVPSSPSFLCPFLLIDFSSIYGSQFPALGHIQQFLTGCWTLWLLHSWVSQFCCLLLNNVGLCRNMQLGYLRTIFIPLKPVFKLCYGWSGLALILGMA